MSDRRALAITLFFAAILGGSASAAFPSAAQSQNPPPSNQQQQQSTSQQAQQPPTQQQQPQQGTAQQPPPPKTPPSDSSPPGSTSQEDKNLQYERKTGTSKDRILWMMPDFLTVQDAGKIPPLTSGQKFKVVGRSLIDPFEFVLIGFVSGINQAGDSDPSYGQGAQGYGKRYATAYGDNAIENFMASAVLPSLLHQDPRYYELGHGGFLRRTSHALSRIVITRSDSGQKQFNYSEIFGAGIAAAISTYSYHPQQDRSGGQVASVWGSQIGWDVATIMIKEFWPDVRRKHQKKVQPGTP